MEVLVYGKISSRKYYQTNLVILPILESQSRRTQRPYVQRVKLYCERTDLTRKLDGRASHFQAKLHFTTSFTFKKGKLKVKFTLFGKYFQSKIQFQDKNIHKPIFPPHPNFPIKKGADIRSQRPSHLTHIKKKEEPGTPLLNQNQKKSFKTSNIDGIELFPL